MNRPLWRRIKRQNFIRLPDLFEFLELSPEQQSRLPQNPSFPLNLPRRLAAKMAKGDLCDPLFLQFVPTKEELLCEKDFGCDPVGDCDARRSPKLLHKYQGRALLVCTSACCVHCRYCFRQHFDYASRPLFSQELELLRQDKSIKEVLLSGGDPLSLDNRVLRELIDNLSTIPHLSRLRFHSRFPIGIPERIDEEFIEILASCRFQIYFVIHCNHSNELDEDLFQALDRIRHLGIPVLNQAVLLKGVNDSVEVLRDLCERLADRGIQPYYLHQLDRVQGAAHFEVSTEKGLQLVRELRALLPGYAVPQYVAEIAGEPSKTPLLSP